MWELELKQKGYSKKVLDSWRQTRQLAYVIFMGNADPEKVQGLTVEQFMPLGDEKVKRQVPQLHKRKDFKDIVEKLRNGSRRNP